MWAKADLNVKLNPNMSCSKLKYEAGVTVSGKMNEVNRTLYIPLYGKAKVSKKNIILKDPIAERIWEAEAFDIKGKSRSKWLTYNMAMRARIFDDWTDEMLSLHENATVLHIGCGLDSRAFRVKHNYKRWIDCDFPSVIDVRRAYYDESDKYTMMSLDASKASQLGTLPDGDAAVVILEGISMYLTSDQLHDLFKELESKYALLHILMDVYTVFGAKASRYKNPVNDVGVTKVYGIDDPDSILYGLGLKVSKEHSLTPDRLVNELSGSDRLIFKFLFTGSLYRRIYRLFELESVRM